MAETILKTPVFWILIGILFLPAIWRLVTDMRFFIGKRERQKAPLIAKEKQFMENESRLLLYFKNICLTRAYYTRSLLSGQPRFTLFYGIFLDEQGRAFKLQMPYTLYKGLREGQTALLTFRHGLLLDADGFEEAQTLRRRRTVLRVVAFILSAAALCFAAVFIFSDLQKRKALSNGISMQYVAPDEAQPLLRSMGLDEDSIEGRIAKISYHEGSGTTYGSRIDLEMQIEVEGLDDFIDGLAGRYYEVETPYTPAYPMAEQTLADTVGEGDRLFFRGKDPDFPIAAIPPDQLAVYRGNDGRVTIRVMDSIVSPEQKTMIEQLFSEKK
ncbi:hypothetical protein [Christensenella tenuis]|uniref:DUF3592 domain-containing protein n=1 Tax=Christensenella tenuis TaxID=2763033 RepID=A0ABR7ECZ4_9FIRM|nr:hypothetical protein [Christensenella tenuis]MBC5647666.1 hypothetical protein [Christensenella tenuis]